QTYNNGTNLLNQASQNWTGQLNSSSWNSSYQIMSPSTNFTNVWINQQQPHIGLNTTNGMQVLQQELQVNNLSNNISESKIPISNISMIQVQTSSLMKNISKFCHPQQSVAMNKIDLDTSLNGVSIKVLLNALCSSNNQLNEKIFKGQFWNSTNVLSQSQNLSMNSSMTIGKKTDAQDIQRNENQLAGTIKMLGSEIQVNSPNFNIKSRFLDQQALNNNNRSEMGVLEQDTVASKNKDSQNHEFNISINGMTKLNQGPDSVHHQV
uniref:Uncharacterized protein n=1 Tax=Romanomermis culicivorax TaxID=13658 RepID=A0A915JWH2_ROMCU